MSTDAQGKPSDRPFMLAVWRLLPAWLDTAGSSVIGAKALRERIIKDNDLVKRAKGQEVPSPCVGPEPEDGALERVTSSSRFVIAHPSTLSIHPAAHLFSFFSSIHPLCPSIQLQHLFSFFSSIHPLCPSIHKPLFFAEVLITQDVQEVWHGWMLQEFCCDTS